MIAGLEGMRGLGFIAVYLAHAHYLEIAWIVIPMFFVMSGFLISGLLFKAKEASTSKNYFISFYGRRALRIFPVYYLALAILWFISPLLMGIPDIDKRPISQIQEQLPFAATYTYNFYHASSLYQHSYFLTHFWSLSVEEQFYLVFPLFVWFVPKKNMKKCLLGIVIFCPMLRAITALIYKYQLLPFLNVDTSISIYVLTWTHLDAFAFGALLHFIKPKKPLLQLGVLTMLIPAVGLLFQRFSTGDFGKATAFGYELGMSNSYKQIWGYTLFNYYFFVLIYVVAFGKNFLKVLTFQPIAWLGKISYGLYIFHFGIQGLCVNVFSDNRIFGLAVGFVLTIIVAAMSYYLFEQPLLNLKEKYFPYKKNSGDRRITQT